MKRRLKITVTRVRRIRGHGETFSAPVADDNFDAKVQEVIDAATAGAAARYDKKRFEGEK